MNQFEMYLTVYLVICYATLALYTLLLYCVDNDLAPLYAVWWVFSPILLPLGLLLLIRFWVGASLSYWRCRKNKP